MVKERSYELLCNESKLVFEYNDALGGYGYSLHLQSKEGWKQISGINNPLVSGKSFHLFPQTIQVGPNKELLVGGVRKHVHTKTGSGEYHWNGIIKADPKTGWMNIRVQVESEEDILLQMADGYEPEIRIDMGKLPPYERGNHVWFKTSITGPTKWNDDAYGNDIPALYYYDPYGKYQVMMFFDMTSMSWMSEQNIARFLNYRCSIQRIYRGEPTLHLGLMADGFSGKTFPKGVQVFEYYLNVNSKETPVTEQEAVSLLTEVCLTLLPAKNEWPEQATSWKDFSVNCARELLDQKACWSRKEACEFLIAYVNGFCPAWQDVMEAQGTTSSFYEAFDFCVTVWTLYPLLVLHKSSKDPVYIELADKIMETVKYVTVHWDDKKLVYSEAMGTWQYLIMLHDLFRISVLNGYKPGIDRVLQQADLIAVPFAEKIGYLFPLSFNMKTLCKAGNGDNYPVAGLYSSLMLELYDYTGDDKYLVQAKAAIHALYNLPVQSVLQEAMLTAYGVQSALRLSTLTGDKEYLEIARYLFAQNLRLAFWYNDKTRPEYMNYNTLGMFQACTPMLYPAFLENTLCLTLLSMMFRYLCPQKGVLRFFNLGRINNFYMFPQCLPENYHLSDLLHIPLENLGVLEYEKTGYVGQEIYGSGGVFWMYLLWEAHARCVDRNIMVMNLSLFEKDCCTGTEELLFIVYNPYDHEVNTKIQFSAIYPEDTIRLGESPEVMNAEVFAEGNEVCVTMEADSHIYIKVIRKQA